MTSWRVIEGDCREVLTTLEAGSAHTCVTSPPYFGLRDYGTGSWEGGDPDCDHATRTGAGLQDRESRETPGGRGGSFPTTGTRFGRECPRCGARRVDKQIGLESIPDEFVAALVAVFREVRRVLRDDGTVWLNLGDSYAAAAKGSGGVAASGLRAKRDDNGQLASDRHSHPTMDVRRFDLVAAGCKPKDLLGIPWMVAFALRQPWYAGTITNELDRVWLAAMIDAEGCIYIHRRPAGASNGQGYVRKADSFGSGLEVANRSLRVVERCQQITGRGSISRQDKDRRQPLYRWCLRTNECRDVLQEVYPYLIAKQHEARIACGVPSSGPKATAAWEALKLLHGGSDTRVDSEAPESLHTPGWYLRSDVIWSKLNPMPESVTDRPTRSHEYVFLLTKAPRYFFDADAIREPVDMDYLQARTGGRATDRGRSEALSGATTATGQADRTGSSNHVGVNPAGRNKRSVWTVATQPYPGAHFATFPPKLIEPCILAGAPEGGMVLDPFSGAGTTGMVALRHGRSYVGIELSPEYAQMARHRIIDDAPLLNSFSHEEVAA